MQFPRVSRIALAIPVLLAWLGTPLLAAGNPEAAGNDPEPRRPNFLLIVADDMGYSDLGAYGGEIHTPNLDRLARDGVRFSQFYVSPTCSPTRAMLLTGNDHHLAGLGSMAEALRPEQRGKPGYEGYLNRSVATIAERLGSVGYSTAMTGKWHLGGAPDQLPAARGFNRSFALVNGAANYYGLDQGGQWARTPFAARYYADGQPATLPDMAYTTDYFTTRMIDFLREAHWGSERPFFAYLAFNAPHTPLQAPRDLVEKYAGRYDEGPEALRSRRLKRLVDMGLVGTEVVPHPMLGVAPWSSLPPEARKASARRMEVYAAAVESMDVNVGRLLDQLRENGQLSNTIIIFISDNGAEGSDERVWLGFLKHLGLPETLVGPMQAANENLDSVGSAQSYAAYGPAWAQAAMAPFRLTKGFVGEGGVRAPLIVSGPGVKANEVEHSVVHVTDIVPTMLNLANATATDVGGNRVHPPQGISFLSQLRGVNPPAGHYQRVIGMELFGRRAIRQGAWKAVFSNTPRIADGSGHGAPRWQLFDLEADPGETRDLAGENPDVIEDLAAAWDAYARENGVVVVPPLERRGASRPAAK